MVPSAEEEDASCLASMMMQEPPQSEEQTPLLAKPLEASSIITAASMLPIVTPQLLMEGGGNPLAEISAAPPNKKDPIVRRRFDKVSELERGAEKQGWSGRDSNPVVFLFFERAPSQKQAPPIIFFLKKQVDLAILEREFVKHKKPNDQTLQAIADLLANNDSVQRIKTWFARRRTKHKEERRTRNLERAANRSAGDDLMAGDGEKKKRKAATGEGPRKERPKGAARKPKDGAGKRKGRPRKK